MPPEHPAQSASLMSQGVSSPRGTDGFCGLPTKWVGTEAPLPTLRAPTHARARGTHRAGLLEQTLCTRERPAHTGDP